jgi:hypothetical protein
MPQRIQRQRTKGWKMPENTVYVGRGSRWGNPYRIGARDRRTGGVLDRSVVIERFTEALVVGHLRFAEADCIALRGKNLACWCSLNDPCHADVLLELANKPACEGA